MDQHKPLISLNQLEYIISALPLRPPNGSAPNVTIKTKGNDHANQPDIYLIFAWNEIKEKWELLNEDVKITD